MKNIQNININNSSEVSLNNISIKTNSFDEDKSSTNSLGNEKVETINVDILRKLLIENKIEKAFELLLKYFKSINNTIYNEIIQLFSRYNQNETEMRLNIIPSSEYSMNLDRIRINILDIIGKIK